MEGSSSKDTQSVQSEIQNMKQNISAMLSVVQQMSEAWSTLAKKRHRHDSDSDSDSPPPKSNRSDNQDDIADLFSNCNKSEDEDDNWDLLDDIKDLKDDEEKGPPVKDKLTEKVNNHFMGNLGSETLAMKQKSYLSLNNCNTLMVPRCNEEIWRKVDKNQRQTDICMAGIQRAITSGATVVVQMLEALLSSGKSSGSMDKQSLVTRL